MSKAINMPSAGNQPAKTPYEKLYGKPIAKDKEAEMHFNLVNFVETLIAMDRQKQAWDKHKKDQPKEES
jgi:hypothetical protein